MAPQESREVKAMVMAMETFCIAMMIVVMTNLLGVWPPAMTDTMLKRFALIGFATVIPSIASFMSVMLRR